MSNATEEARSTRRDARAFADAFAAADDAFTFGADAGESRTLTLAELGDVIALDRPVAPPGPRTPAASAVRTAGAASFADDDELLTLDQLGEALARAARGDDIPDFDFGTSAHERARRRTAARFDASPPARRRVSGPARAATRPRRTAGGHTEVTPGPERLAPGLPERRAPGPAGHRAPGPAGRRAPGSAARAAMAAAAASAAERLAGPAAVQRVAGERTTALRLDAARALPTSLRPSDDFLADPDARRTVEITGRPGGNVPVPRLREVEPGHRAPRVVAHRLGANPDRIAMWAVLLGILLVLIAFTTGSAGAVALPLISAL